MFNLKKKSLKQLDILLLLSAVLLSVYGIFVLYSAYAGSLASIKSQIFSTLLGFLLIIIICTMDLDVLKKIYIPVYFLSIFLLGLTVVFGRGGQEWGSDSWLVLGPISFQPSEITKVGLIFVLAAHMDKYKNRINELPVLLGTLIIAGLPVFLIMLQPDFGTAMVYLFFIAVMLFVGGLDWKWIIILLTIGLVAFVLMLLNLEGYQANRILDFLDPARDTSGSGWQQQQGLIAIGSGMLRGRGFMQGTQSQYGYIPEKETDYIFSVLAEELGFIGSLLMLILFAVLIFRQISIIKKSNNTFISLLVAGICGMFFIHIFENVGMTIGIMPVTGIPLPFFSYGGTFQLISLINVGLCLSASLQKTYYDIETSEAETLTIQNPRALAEKNK
ncbi:MAG: rod shape-determining protein RodA [Anaerococcus sp.]|nr:rod shape-determining protein RodA [Peptoniphilaceae bacterium]MDY3055908.1 rod shape-determining protein RodA [Anaerococcus sp.]